jgi:hypothetical protein
MSASEEYVDDEALAVDAEVDGAEEIEAVEETVGAAEDES